MIGTTNGTTQDTNPLQIMVPAGASHETALLIAILAKGKPGDEITDDELSRRIGKTTKVGGDAYSNLQTAIRATVKNHAVYWKRVRGENKIRCATAQEYEAESRSNVFSIRRKVKRGKHIVKAGLANGGDVQKLNMIGAQLGVLELMSSKKAAKQIESRGPIPVDNDRLLDAFKTN